MSDFITGLWVRLSNRVYAEEGQAVTEYAVVLVLIVAIAAALTATNLGSTIVTKISDQLSNI